MENVANNNDVLSNLYALRAGLSVISQKADQMKDTEKKIESQLELITEMKWFWEKGKIEDYDCLMYYEDFKERNERLKELEKIKIRFGYVRAMEWEAKFDEKYDFKSFLMNKMAFCEWLKTNEAEQYFSAKIKDAEVNYKRKLKLEEECRVYRKKEDMFRILKFLTIPTILGAIWFKIKESNYIVLRWNCVKELDKYGDSEKELNKYKTDLQNIKSSREIIKKNDEENMPIVKAVKQDTDVIYESLQKQFGKVLDERDWQYLDLIIYYLETGRADSKKEALQLLENEIQAQRIVGAIQKATESICSTIERVADRISAQLGVISSQLALISSQYQVQIEQNNILISQAQMQNALIAKAGVTSEQLMKDVSYIKKNGIAIK